MNTTDTSHRKGLVGASPSNNNYWLYDSQTGFDLTHPSTPDAPPLHPGLTLPTTTLPITISPPKSALVIVDMQNFFLSPNLGRPLDSKGLLAQSQLLKHAIPAARTAGIRIIWLNWGLTDEDLQTMPPATFRAFGFDTVPAAEFPGAFGTSSSRLAAIDSHGVNELAPQISRDTQVEAGGKNPRIYRGLGSEIGPVTLDSGEKIDGGRLLFRESWNAALTPELDAEWEKGRKLQGLSDVWLHKNRMSGLWGQTTDATDWIDREGIRTLIFAGVNTDQCVGGSLQDAFSKGYDCIMLSDGTGTTSPAGAQESVEFNCAKTWGFCMTCKMFAEGVGRMAKYKYASTDVDAHVGVTVAVR